MVPYSHAKRLFELAREPKQLWTIEGGATRTLADPGSRIAKGSWPFFNESLEGDMKQMTSPWP